MKLQKTLTILLIFTFLFSFVPNISMASKGISVIVDGSLIQFDAQPFIDTAGRTMVPVRFVAEKLNATVNFEEKYNKQLILISKNKLTIQLTIGDEMLITRTEGIEKPAYTYMDTKPIIKDSRTFIPLRYVVETLGATINWNSNTSTITISSKYIGTEDSSGQRDYGARFEILKPKLGVAPDRKFIFPIKYYDYKDGHIGNDYAEVYSDPACLNKVFASIDLEPSKDYKTASLVISPPIGPNLRKSYDDQYVWGEGPSFYIVFKADIEANKFTKLDKFRRMMFTVSTPVDIPTLQFSLSSQGLATLKWSKVEGADEYKVYAGFDDVLDEVIATTKDTQYSSFTPPEHKETINFDFMDRYAVVAVKDGKESRLSNVIDSKDYDQLIPQTMSYKDGDNRIELSYKSFKDLPSAVDLSTLAGYDAPVLPYKVKFDFKNAAKFTRSYLSGYTLPYKILNTPFTGTTEVMCEDKEDALLAELQKSQDKITSNNGVIDPPVPQSTNESKIKEEKPDPKKEDTAEKIKPAKNDLYSYLTENMIKQNKDIDVSAYDEAMDWGYLKDLVFKIFTQEPLVMDAKGFSFDYYNKKLSVTYTPDNDIQSKISAVKAEAKKVISQIIKPGMSLAEKEKAIHDYITNSAEYDWEALKNGEKNDYKKVDDIFKDSFNAYGILVKKVGVCASYAASFTLLCREAGIDAITITGTMNGVGHAWNKFKINDKWYNVDATNNDNREYPVYNASDSSIRPQFVIENDFELDENVEKFMTDDNSQDYFTINKLTAKSITDAFTLANELAKTKNNFSIKVLSSTPIDGFDIMTNRELIPEGFSCTEPFASVITFIKE
ncbi:MAG TPA: stalk domain-containing protein [Pseudobacteroides sp.]|uniref:stalk domain-containing protein n=1 Tax=Pseudobacteroides sp. TaxID=1968840 RepID=UPI002F9402A0